MHPSSSIVKALGPRDREIVLDRLVRRVIRRKETLYFAGEEGERAHFIGSGIFKLAAHGADGSETILCLALPGELVGEVSALDGLPHPLDAVAVTKSEVYGIESGLMIEILERNPRAMAALSLQMARRQRWLYESAQERSGGEVPARLAGRLLNLAELLGSSDGRTIEMHLPLGQNDLGSLAGMCRESACKTLRMFKAAGLLDYKGRKVRILRPEGLERVRCGARLPEKRV